MTTRASRVISPRQSAAQRAAPDQQGQSPRSMERARRPPKAGNRARRFRSSSLGDKLPRSVWGNLRCPRLALAALRVDSLPRSEWTPCRQSAALRRKSVGTSAAPPALRASAARGDIRMESAPRRPPICRAPWKGRGDIRRAHPPRGCARTRDFHMGLPTPLSRLCPRTWEKP